MSTLFYCMGEEAESVLSSTGISDADREKYDAVKAKFDAFFKIRRNVIFERAKFNRRAQLEGESVEQFIMDLYTLVENCDYGRLKDEMIRDRIVVRIRNTALSERMQGEATLTLEKAGSKQSPIMLGQVKGHKPQARRRDTVRSDKMPHDKGVARTTSGKPQCTRCGRSKHQKGDGCPAKEAIRHKCNRKGHFQSQWFSKTVAATTSELSLDTAFVMTVSSKQ